MLFLLYHYYEAREIYNAIRIFIAGYVWMTGFGNFSYYYKTGNYSFSRQAKPLGLPLEHHFQALENKESPLWLHV